MNDLIQQAEALEVRACDHESAAKNLTVAAEKCRAEAVKLREQAASRPRERWLSFRAVGGQELVMGAYETPTAGCIRFREVRPVRITDEQAVCAWQAYMATPGQGPTAIRSVMEYALSLAGVEVVK